MAQLRQDQKQFVARGAEVVVVGPDSASALKEYRQKENLPFVILPDPDHVVAKQYSQQVSLLKGGRMPALMIIDKAGQIRYKHYGSSMSDIPSSQELLGILDKLNQEL